MKITNSVNMLEATKEDGLWLVYGQPLTQNYINIVTIPVLIESTSASRVLAACLKVNFPFFNDTLSYELQKKRDAEAKAKAEQAFFEERRAINFKTQKQKNEDAIAAKKTRDEHKAFMVNHKNSRLSHNAPKPVNRQQATTEDLL